MYAIDTSPFILLVRLTEAMEMSHAPSETVETKATPGKQGWSQTIRELLVALGPPFDRLAKLPTSGRAGAIAIGAFLTLFVIPLAIPLIVSWWLLIPVDWAPIKSIREAYIATVREGFGVINTRLDYFHSFEYDSVFKKDQRIRISLVSGQLAVVRIDSVWTDFVGKACASSLPEPPGEPILELRMEGTASIMPVRLTRSPKVGKIDRDWWNSNKEQIRQYFEGSEPRAVDLYLIPTPAGQTYKAALRQACPTVMVSLAGTIEVYKERSFIQ